jgi:hypothetical protein
MFLQMSEEYLGRRSRSQRQASRGQRREQFQQKRSAFRGRQQEKLSKFRDKMRRFYVPQNIDGRVAMVREDLLDDLNDREYKEAEQQGEELSSQYLSEEYLGEYLSGKAERQERRERRKETRTQRKELRTASKEAGVARKQAKAGLIEKRGEAKIIRAQRPKGDKSTWEQITGGVSDVVGSFSGKQPEGDEQPADWGVNIEGGFGSAPPKKNYMPYYIGGGLIIITGIIIAVVASKKK